MLNIKDETFTVLWHEKMELRLSVVCSCIAGALYVVKQL